MWKITEKYERSNQVATVRLILGHTKKYSFIYEFWGVSRHLILFLWMNSLSGQKRKNNIEKQCITIENHCLPFLFHFESK